MSDYDGYYDIDEKALEAEAILKSKHGRKEFKHYDLTDMEATDYEKFKRECTAKRIRKARAQSRQFKHYNTR